MALLDLIGWGFSYSISKTPSTRINANSVTWCFIHEKLALLGKTEIEYEKAQSASSGDNVSVFASVKSWDEPASLVRRSADILVKRAGNGEDTRELARILHCCPIRPLDAGERENAAGLVVGFVVELDVMTDWDGDAGPYSPSSAIICFMARAHSSCFDMNPGHASSLPLILHPFL